MPARLIFAGTPGFALASLQALVEAGTIPLAVLTQPDRPTGRGRKIEPGPVKRYALEHGIPVWQPATLINRAVAAKLEELEPDAMVVAAYGLLLPKQILALPRSGCINVHASLLPRWRGASPVQAAILAGDRRTGVSLMKMEAGLDTGAVYVQEALTIGDRETAGDLHDRLALLGGRLLVRSLPAILAHELSPVPQNESEASYAGKIRTQDALLDWRLPARQLEARIRAYNPVPGARFMLDDEAVKCWSAEVAGGASAPPGTVLAFAQNGRGGLEVACGEGAIRLLEVQRPGRGRISAAEFERQVSLNGRRLAS
jgi:methionyl-tRNA formyltransferase